MFPDALETDSLALRSFTPEHVDEGELYDLFAAARDDADEVFAYVPQEPYGDVADARDHLADAEAEWADGESAQYAVYVDDGERGSGGGRGALAGHTGLVVERERRAGRVGVILAKPHWGEGYATECALALTRMAFEDLDLELVEVGHEAGNERSKRFIEGFVDRVGGQYDGVLRNWTRVGDDVLDQHRYTVTREQWTGGE